jgi:hypothetical protein
VPCNILIRISFMSLPLNAVYDNDLNLIIKFPFQYSTTSSSSLYFLITSYYMRCLHMQYLGYIECGFIYINLKPGGSVYVLFFLPARCKDPTTVHPLWLPKWVIISRGVDRLCSTQVCDSGACDHGPSGGNGNGKG